MRVLITGANGFIGGHMAEALLAEGGHTLSGLSRFAEWPGPLQHLSRSVRHFAVELSEAVGLGAILKETRPEWIFHFAGYANTGKSFSVPARCWADNLDGTRSLYDAVHASGVKPRILFVSTGLIYGDPISDTAFDETAEFRPASPYAASKAAADAMSYQYTRHPGLDIVRMRLFNQIGPRQSPDYAVANFARQIALIEAGKQKTLETGDLSARRDITDVRDIVAAFRLLMDNGERGEAYNAGRGETYRIQELLNKLLSFAKVPIDVKVTVDPTRIADTAVTKANTNKLLQATGWTPRISLDQSLKDILNFWRFS
jgi:GDP-4-dehydro-6-deoxy-D-mannose reductase